MIALTTNRISKYLNKACPYLKDLILFAHLQEELHLSITLKRLRRQTKKKKRRRILSRLTSSRYRQIALEVMVPSTEMELQSKNSDRNNKNFSLTKSLLSILKPTSQWDH